MSDGGNIVSIFVAVHVLISCFLAGSGIFFISDSLLAAVDLVALLSQYTRATGRRDLVYRAPLTEELCSHSRLVRSVVMPV